MSGFSSFKESKLLFENWRKFLVKEARNQDFINEFEVVLQKWNELQATYGEIPDYSLNPEGEYWKEPVPQDIPSDEIPDWAKRKSYEFPLSHPNSRRAYFAQTKKEEEIEKELLRLFQKYADQSFFQNEVQLFHDLNYPAAAHPLFDDALEFSSAKQTKESYLDIGDGRIKDVMSCHGFVNRAPNGGYGLILRGHVVFASRADLASQTLRTAHSQVRQKYAASGVPKRAGITRVHGEPSPARLRVMKKLQKKEEFTPEELNNIKNSVVLDGGDIKKGKIEEVLVANSKIIGFWTTMMYDGTILAEDYFRKALEKGVKGPFFLSTNTAVKPFDIQNYFQAREEKQ